MLPSVICCTQATSHEGAGDRRDRPDRRTHCEALISRNHTVRALVRQDSARDALAGLPVSYAIADVLDPSADLVAACADCDVVFHTASHFAYTGFSPALLHDTAVAGTEAVLKACAHAGVPRVIVTSSSVVFGYRNRTVALDEDAGLASDDGESPYVRAKIAQHRHTLELGERLNLDVRLACPTMTLGPTSARLGPSNGLVVAYLADPLALHLSRRLQSCLCARRGARPSAHRGARQSLAKAICSDRENMTWQQIHTSIAELAGVAPPRVTLNHSLAYLAATADELRAAINGRTALSTREQATMVGRYYWYSHAKAARSAIRPYRRATR